MLDQGNGAIGYVTLGVGIGEALAGSLFLALSAFATADPYGDFIEKQCAAGKSSGEIVVAVESRWRDDAERLRSSRRTNGLLLVVGASVSVAVGAVLALTPPGLNLSTSDQYGLAAEMLVLGGFSVFSGLRTIFVEEPIEAGWEAYTAGKSRPTSAFKVNGLGFAPTPGGGIVGLGATF